MVGVSITTVGGVGAEYTSKDHHFAEFPLSRGYLAFTKKMLMTLPSNVVLIKFVQPMEEKAWYFADSKKI